MPGFKVLKSTPQFLGVKDWKYIQDDKQETEVDTYITDKIKNIYVLVNKKDKTIIGSLGKIEGELQNVDTKIVMDQERKEYIEKGESVNITKIVDKELLDDMYSAIHVIQ